MKKAKTYVKSILVPVLVGGIVGVIISRFIDFDTLNQPPLSPPSIAFPVVWTILYVLMGISYGMIKIDGRITNEINKIYYTQLGVNALWPIFFFVFKWRFFSFIWILILAILVLMMVVKFYRQNKTAGLLQIPYFLWTLFASYLNIGVYLLNR